MEQMSPELEVETTSTPKKLKTALEIAMENTQEDLPAPTAEQKAEQQSGSGSLKSAAEIAMAKTDAVAEQYNETKPEKGDIEGASTFEELDTLIDDSKGLQGSQEFFDPAKLKEIIGRVKAGELGIEYVTRSQGLRDKVAQLLETQKAAGSAGDVERNGSTDPAVHAYGDNSFDTIVASQPENYTVGNEKPSEEPAEKTVEAAPESAEDPLDFEAIGKARLERILARAAEAQGQVQSYGKSLWEKAKDYTAKGAKAIGTAVKKAFYMTFAVPELLDASDAFFGEKYAALIEAGNAKYKEIADKITGAKEAFLNRVKAAQERRQERRDRISQAKAAIAAEKAKLSAARWDLKSKFALF